MKIKTFVFNAFSENTYLIYDDTGVAAIIDPGCGEPYEQKQIENFIQQNNLDLQRLILTHCHIDHVMGCKFIYEKYGLLPEHHEIEKSLLANAQNQARFFGIDCPQPPAAKNFIQPNTQIQIGKITLKVLFTPGHSPGSVSFYHEESKTVFSGDVLFQGSIGRTDLPGGSYEILMESISHQLIPLGEEVKVLSGHGTETTIGREKKYNPFLN